MASWMRSAATNARSGGSVIGTELGEMLTYNFGGGLTLEETAAVLGVSVPTVVKETRLARAWLHSQIAAGPPPTTMIAAKAGTRPHVPPGPPAPPGSSEP